MKQILLIAAFVFFSIAAMATSPLKPLDKEDIEKMTEQERAKRVEMLDERLAEIKATPLNNLERTERKELRKEVKGIQKEARALQGAGVYISAGALLVALILVLLLV